MAKRSDSPVAEISFDSLSSGFVMSKPKQQEAYDESEIYKLEREGRLIITRKRDGWKLLLVQSGGHLKVYTDGIRDVTDRLGHIVSECFRKPFPDKSIIAAEGLMTIGDGEDRGRVTTVLNSARERSIEAQHTNGLLRPMAFDVLFWGGVPLLGSTQYSFRLEIIQSKCAKYDTLLSLEVLKVSFDEAKELVRKNSWEGLVLYDTDFRGSFRLDGKDPQRPNGCFKWKPILEDDFAVYSWIPSGKNPERLKELRLTQTHPVTGRPVDCGKLGTFTNEMRERLKNMNTPFVVQVAFDARFPSGKLCNKRFVCLREDKKPENCIAPSSLFK